MSSRDGGQHPLETVAPLGIGSSVGAKDRPTAVWVLLSG
jgi:hypothetical protein